MRDIRNDLRERLGVIEDRRNTIMRALKDLDMEREALVKALEYEVRRFNSPAAAASDVDKARAAIIEAGKKLQADLTPLTSTGFLRLPPITKFIEDLLNKTPLTKGELREKAEAAGYFRGEEAAGRVLHTTLMNLERHGRIRVRDDGRYENALEPEVQGVS